MSKLKETQPNPNRTTPNYKVLAAGAAFLALASGAALLARKENSGSPANANTPATTEAPVVATDTPPVPSTAEVGEVNKEALNSVAQNSAESFVVKTIEQAKKANGSTIGSEMSTNGKGGIDFVVRTQSDSVNGLVNDSVMSFTVSGNFTDVEKVDLSDINPADVTRFRLETDAIMSYPDGAQSGNKVINFSMFKEQDGWIIGSEAVTQTGDEQNMLFDLGHPEGTNRAAAVSESQLFAYTSQADSVLNSVMQGNIVAYAPAIAV